MSFGYAPVDEEEVADPLPGNAAPLGMTPEEEQDIPPVQGLPPAVPGTGHPAGAAGADAPAPESSFSPGAGALPPPTLAPPPSPPQPTGDPAKDIEANQAYGRALNDWHTQAVQTLTGTQND